MSAITFGESIPRSDPFGDWYRNRPTQLAFAVSLALHALLIAVVPGFRSVPLETPTVLTVQIVNEEPALEQAPEPEPVVRRSQPVPEPVAPPELAVPPKQIATPRQISPRELTAPPERVLPPDLVAPAELVTPVEPAVPPDLLAPAPAPRVVEQRPLLPTPAIEPQPVPLVRQLESPPAETVVRAELAPSLPRQKPQFRPNIVARPELVPTEPAVPVIESAPAAQVKEPVSQPLDLRRQRPLVRQAPGPVQPQPRPDAPAPDIRTQIAQPSQLQPPVAAPAAPAPVAEAPPAKQVEPRRPPAVMPPVTAAAVKPSAPAPVAAPAPAPAPRPEKVLETVEESVLEAYRQSVSQEVMKHMSYPRVAVMRKWQGKTVVEMQLSADGAVTQLVVVESSGKEILDKAAVAMVRRSLPLPKPPQGVRTVKVPVVFRLQG